ncbi:MAG: WGR domain-containing protein [Anaerolineae bacterium]|nr:WGR domain-containing protein [Anaerolineae bacterium]
MTSVCPSSRTVSKVSREWLLTRVDPAKRCYRWYRVHVQATLLDPFAVVCAWGSLRTKYRRQRSIPCAGWVEAERTAEKIIEQKLHRGYKEKSFLTVA